MRMAYAAIAVAGCGSISMPVIPGETDAAVVPQNDDVVLDRSCAEVKGRLGIAEDGVHDIDPDRDGPLRPFAVFCADMSSPAPVEFLELPHRALPDDPAPASNFTTYGMGAPHASWNCDCGVSTAVFTKVRFDPATLAIDVYDRRFATFTTSTRLDCIQATPTCPGLGALLTPFGNAGSCVGNVDASGHANVDLRDLPFHVAETAQFDLYENLRGGDAGFTSAGAARIDPTRKIVDLDGGGDCGGFGAALGLPLAAD